MYSFEGEHVTKSFPAGSDDKKTLQKATSIICSSIAG